MAQSNTVMAFRKRLRIRGFCKISIRQHGIFYHVSFIDPACGQCFEYGITESRMISAFKRRIRS